MLKVATCCTLFVIAAPAFAQNVSETFSGVFAGVQGGWQQDRLMQSDPSGVFRAGNSKASGFTYGGQVGYDFRVASQVVTGAEVALTGRSGVGVVNYFGTTYDLRQGRTASATARVGYLGTESDLFYVRGGYANARYTFENGPGGRSSRNRDGYTIGAGYEHMLTPSISARVEYGYSDFGNDSVATGNAVAKLQYRRHAVTAGANFRF